MTEHSLRTNAPPPIRRRSFNDAAHKLGDPPEPHPDADAAARAPRGNELDAFLAGLATAQPAVRRVPGTAIFLSSPDGGTPPELEAEVEHKHALADRLVIVSVARVDGPTDASADRLAVQARGPGRCRVLHVTIRTGDGDAVDIRASLKLARKRGLLERSLDLEHASYFTRRAADT